MPMPFLADIPNERNFWLIVVMAGATIILAVFRPSMRKKKDPLARTPSRQSLSQQRNVERQMESLLVELSEMSRQITAQLDTRSAKLQALIEDADKRLAALQQCISQIEQASERRPVSPVRVADAAAPAAESDPLQASPHVETLAVEPMPANPRHAEVYALADVGTAATDIARQLNRPRGEVELILALRSRGG